jgi:hypothetical protein
MSVVLTNGTSSVTLNVANVSNTTIKNINIGTYRSGNDIILDEGRDRDYITLTGYLTGSTASTYCGYINDLAEAGEEVTISGLPDSEMNVDYLIYNITIDEKGGKVNYKQYSIVLERARD